MAVLTQLGNTTFCSGHEECSRDLNTLQQGLKGHLDLSLSLPGTHIRGFLITEAALAKVGQKVTTEIFEIFFLGNGVCLQRNSCTRRFVSA